MKNVERLDNTPNFVWHRLFAFWVKFLFKKNKIVWMAPKSPSARQVGWCNKMNRYTNFILFLC